MKRNETINTALFSEKEEEKRGKFEEFILRNKNLFQGPWKIVIASTIGSLMITAGIQSVLIHLFKIPFTHYAMGLYIAGICGSTISYFMAQICIQFYKVLLEIQEKENLSKLQAAEFKKVVILTDSFKRFVPYEILESLDKNSIVEIELGDVVQKNMSVLFSDIRSFTSLSESMTPDENFKFLNSFLSHISPVIKEHRGFIDKFIGDAIMALFSRSADDAVKAAIGMLQKLSEYNGYREKTGYIPIQIGIGINTGDLMLGTIGEQNRMEGTVISDAVNLASRIEGMTKMYGVSILITEHTFNMLNNPYQYNIRLIDKVTAKGKSEPVTIYEIFDGMPLGMKELKFVTKKIYEDAISLYFNQEFSKALQLFQTCLTKNPIDSVSQIFSNRCKHYLDIGWNENWDGVTRLDSK